ELIDNSVEAGATRVEVFIRTEMSGPVIAVRDNGKGMTSETLRLALQFGGSTRFASRTGIGRYGMGLPNSSISQARRLDVYSWRDPAKVLWTYLDVDEVVAGSQTSVPTPSRRRFRGFGPLSQSGTLVVWSNCDRVAGTEVDGLAVSLGHSLGRMFRYFLWADRTLLINGNPVSPCDPLFA